VFSRKNIPFSREHIIYRGVNQDEQYHNCYITGVTAMVSSKDDGKNEGSGDGGEVAGAPGAVDGEDEPSLPPEVHAVDG